MRIDSTYVRAAMGAGAMLAFMLGATGCTNDGGDGTTAPGGPAGAGLSAPTEPGTDQGEDKDADERKAGRPTGSIALGDLDKPKSATDTGAPFDPCGLDWTAWPAPVRPADGKPHQPTQIKPGGDGTGVQCRWDNSGAITIGPGGASAPEGGYFTTTIAWAKDLETDPAQRQGSTGKTWGGHPGWTLPGTSKAGPTCIAVADLGEGRGAAGVAVTNGRFPTVQACDVADTVITAIVAKIQ